MTMSSNEKVSSFNPLMILIWILLLIIYGIDSSDGNGISWSIPVIGSFLIIQIYMIWKTNYDEMVEEQRESQRKVLGGDLINDTPLIQPGVTDLAAANKSTPSPMIDLNLSSTVMKDKKSQEKIENEN